MEGRCNLLTASQFELICLMCMCVRCDSLLGSSVGSITKWIQRNLASTPDRAELKRRSLQIAHWPPQRSSCINQL